MARTRVPVRRTALVGAGVLLAVPLTMAAVAQACTPLPTSFGLVPKSASGAVVVKAVGEGVAPRSPVEVRWEDVKGDLIGAAVADDKGQFSALVAIPQASPGAHAVLFRAQEVGKPGVRTVGRLPFTVTSSDGTEPAPTAAHPPRVRVAAGTEPSGAAPTAGLLMMGAGVVAVALGASAALAGRRRAKADSGLS